MAAYIVLDITVTDTVAYEEYKKYSGATVELYGGKFLVRGGTVEPLEGAWQPSRFVLIEFASPAQARAWWESEEYAMPKSIRQKASISQGILAHGV